MSDIVERSKQLVDDYYAAVYAQDWQKWQSMLHPDILFISATAIDTLATRLPKQIAIVTDPQRIKYKITHAYRVPGSSNCIEVVCDFHYDFSDKIGRNIVHHYVTRFGIVDTQNGLLVYSHQMTEIAPTIQDASLRTVLTSSYANAKVNGSAKNVDGFIRFCEVINQIKNGSNGVTHIYMPHNGGVMWIVAKKSLASELHAGDAIQVFGMMRWNKNAKTWYCDAVGIERL